MCAERFMSLRRRSQSQRRRQNRNRPGAGRKPCDPRVVRGLRSREGPGSRPGDLSEAGHGRRQRRTPGGANPKTVFRKKNSQAMKTLLLSVFFPAWTAPPALSANPGFTVEMFSNRALKALTLEATQQPVRICGAKTDGPCLVLPPGKNASCFADRLLQCRFEVTDRSFTVLAVNSATLMKMTPTFAGGNEQPPNFLVRNARVTPAGGGLQVTTRVDLESYVSAVLRGE